MLRRAFPPGIFFAAIVLLAGLGILAGDTGPIPWIDEQNPSSGVALSDLTRIAISLILMISALWVVLSKLYTASDKHWAYGTIGTVIGFWLKG